MGTQEGKIFVAFGLVALFLAMIIFIFIYWLMKQHAVYRLLEKEKTDAEFKAIEEERNEIATGLHNEIGPGLIGIRLQLLSMKTFDPTALEDCAESLSKSIQQIRGLSHQLAPLSVYNVPFQRALEHYIDNVRGQEKLEISFHEQHDYELSPEAHSHIYRILQEIISNTLKHAQATRLVIETSVEGNQLVIRTADDGVGFDFRAKAIHSNLGLGLPSIERRVRLMQGTLHFPDDFNIGTRYNIRIPIQNTGEKL
jgi:signal transduction histidine kinase